MDQTRVDGIWAVEFRGPHGAVGTGIVFLQNGTILGGDTSYYYTGRFELFDDVLLGEVNIIHHSGEKDSIFGPITHLSMVVEGRYGAPWIMGQLKLSPKLAVAASMKLRRIEDLPGGVR